MALLVLTPNAALDPLSASQRAWRGRFPWRSEPADPQVATSRASAHLYRLATGGRGLLLAVPVALVFDPPIPMPTGTNVLGLAWLGLIGAGLTYFLWFRDLATRTYSCFLTGFLSPGTAVLLGWFVLGSDAECASNHRRPARDREYLAGPTFQPHS